VEIYFIAAMSENRVIGQNGKLPWYLPNDLKHFRKLTINTNVVMGRKTFMSIKKALPHRNNLVLTRDHNFTAENVSIFHSKKEILCKNYVQLMVIGGEEIYRLFLPECQKVFLTLVHTKIFGDAYFPKLDDFIETSCQFHEKDERHQYAYSFVEYIRAQ
jgi:dihydrofolate reductase